MSTVQRTIHLNAIEPAPLSIRTPAKIETWVNFQFYDQRGQIHDQDLACQMHLTGRTTDRTQTYAVPATDMVNGQARAVIPAGDLTDMNGYRLRLFGTWKQQPWLLAMGVLNLIPAAGVDAMPDDVIDFIAMTFARGLDDYVDVKLWHDAGKSVPYDIASINVLAPITEATTQAALTDFLVTQIGFNEVRLSLTAAQVDALPSNCWWKLIVASSGGQQTLAEGPVTITG